MVTFKRKPPEMDSASFHRKLLERICKEEIKRLIANFSRDVYDVGDPLCVFQEPLFTTRGVYFPGEMYVGW